MIPYSRMKALLWCVFLYMYIVWFSEYWLSVTTNLVTWTLAALLLVEWIMPRGRWWKRLLQLLAIGGAAVWTLDYRPHFYVPQSWEQVLNLFQMNTTPLLPYLGFSLIAAVIFLFVLDYANSKKRILFIVSGTLLAFCIADSFTTILFWPSIVILIVCSLLLVIFQHFSKFREQHPASWGTIKEYPGVVIATVVLVVSVMIMAGIFAPQVRPVLTDPYTAWMNHRGETVPNLGKGFLTSGQIQLSNSSGYSRNDETLGGGFTYDYSEVMKVTTSHRSYMRGETRTLYTGQGWQETEVERNARTVPVDESKELELSTNWDISNLETIEVEQTVSILSNEAQYPVLFSAFAPTRIAHLAGENDGEAYSYAPLSWAKEPQELRWEEEQAQIRDQAYPVSYQVISSAPIIDEAGLRTAYDGEGLPPDFNASFLQTPENLPERVSELTREITAESDNPYDKVKAIEQYLSTEFTYTNQPDSSNVTSHDFVDAFLFEVQEGYCDYFSTAMVIMVRELGYPARWVKGYTAGAQNIPDEMEDLMMMEGMPIDEAGEYIVRNADAHSWAEVYFPGWGWIPFEPTAGFAMPAVDAELEANQDSVSLETPESTGEDSETSDSDGISYSQIRFIIIFVIFIFAIGALGYGLIKTRYTKQRHLDGRRKLIAEFNRFLRYAVRKGLNRSADETVREWMDNTIVQHGWLEDELPDLVRVFERAKYSPEPLSQIEVEKALESIRTLRQKLKRQS